MTPQKPVLSKSYEEVKEVVYAENQPEYFNLPAIKLPNGEVITRWKLTFKERLKVLFSGNIFLLLSTFNKPLQPVNILVDEPTIGRFD